MSLGTFIHNLWNDIKGIFEKIDPDLKKAIHAAVVLVDGIKNFDTAAPIVGDIITSLIPGDVDEMIKIKLREWLPKILIELKLTEQCCDLTDQNEIVACAIKTLQQISGDFQSAFLHDIAVLAAQIAADNKITFSDSVALVEFYYKHKYKNERDIEA